MGMLGGDKFSEMGILGDKSEKSLIDESETKEPSDVELKRVVSEVEPELNI